MLSLVVGIVSKVVFSRHQYIDVIYFSPIWQNLLKLNEYTETLFDRFPTLFVFSNMFQLSDRSNT